MTAQGFKGSAVNAGLHYFGLCTFTWFNFDDVGHGGLASLRVFIEPSVEKSRACGVGGHGVVRGHDISQADAYTRGHAAVRLPLQDLRNHL